MIGAIENAMLARLKAAADAGALGYAWRMLDTYPEDWDELFKNKGAINTPAAWATFGGISSLRMEDSGGWRAIATFGLVVAAQNLRNETATRHGHRNQAGELVEPGSYQLMVDAIGLLGDNDFGLDIEPLEVVQAVQVATGTIANLRNISMWATEFRTAFHIPELTFDADGNLADFEIFHANWDVPPFGGVDADPGQAGVQLPADAQADATDHVELPQ